MNKRAKVREEQAAVEAAKVWRQVRWILAGIFAALLVAGLFLTGILPPRKKLTLTDLAVFGQYDAIRHALANEHLDEARHAAEKLAAIADAKPIYTEPAKSVASSDSLAVARYRSNLVYNPNVHSERSPGHRWPGCLSWWFLQHASFAQA